MIIRSSYMIVLVFILHNKLFVGNQLNRFSEKNE